MKKKWLFKMSFFLLLISLKGYSQNLLKNGDFEYPTTDELSLPVHPPGELLHWQIGASVALVNHTRLFPASGYQCLLLPARPGKKVSIVQDFFIEKKGNVRLSFAFAASRLLSGRLYWRIDGNEIASQSYADYWSPPETRLTDHMKWVEVVLPQQLLDHGTHVLEIGQDSCVVVSDNQGDQRDMIEGFLIDNLLLELVPVVHYSGIPSLDELAGQAVETKTLACYPAIGNFIGSVRSSKQMGGFETQFLVGSKLPKTAGGIHINEIPLFSQETQWFPYQVASHASYMGLKISASIRLAFEKKGILIQIDLENITDQSLILPLAVDLVSGKLKQTDTFPGATIIEFSSNNYAYAFNYKPDSIKSFEENNKACWNVSISPGEKKTLSYVVSIDKEASKAVSCARNWNNSFSQTFLESRILWERRWKDVFTPGNKSYSGYLPTFETTDQNLYELYYLSIVSFLETQQNHVYPTLDIAYGSNNEWASNQAYLWEMSQFADMYALLDPKGLKVFVKMALNVNIDHGNAIDYNNGRIVNHWYAVNDYALFKVIDSYVKINRDFDFLKSKCNNKTILEHLNYLATHWEKRYNKEVGLADYGNNPWSFFETNPDYIHFVPAMNAQNVWMLRSMAAYDSIYGNGNNKQLLLDKANGLAKGVMSLYMPGQGVWKVKYPNGDSIVSRHSYDFLTIGMTMNSDLTPLMKSEMIHFVKSELLTSTNFMRAMSLKDKAAFNSDRSDHGPVGCYIGWPAMTVQAMADMGEFEEAKNILCNFRNAFVEAGMGQAIEFLVTVGSSKAVNRIGARAGAAFLLSGSDYANAIIDGLMGYKPSIDGSLSPYRMNSSRNFDGKIINIRHGKSNYTFSTLDKGGIGMQLLEIIEDKK